MKKKAKFLILTVVLLLGLRLWLGVYIHDEFSDAHLFIKHRPTWKWQFYSPIGMSDLQMEDLSLKKQHEQRLFNEFVSSKGLSR